MQMSNLRKASDLANHYGVKSIIYGTPGSGKTPLVATAPRPVALICEPGMLSMRGCSIPCFEAYTQSAIDEFFKWALTSKEMSNFDTLCIDSISNIAEIVLAEKLKKMKHGMQAYGAMSEYVYNKACELYYLKNKHVVMIGKQGSFENGKTTMIQDGTVITEPVMQMRPYFPGKELNIKMPHLFDNVMQLTRISIQGFNEPQRALRTRECSEAFARDRVGNLAEFEQPDLTALFKKSMG